jgi:nucleotide-binding universal stress UspA family protein
VLLEKGVPEQNVTMVIQPTKEGIARDLLNEIEAKHYQLVVVGKRSFQERKPFLMGSHANKILQNLSKAMLCLVDS